MGKSKGPDQSASNMIHVEKWPFVCANAGADSANEYNKWHVLSDISLRSRDGCPETRKREPMLFKLKADQSPFSSKLDVTDRGKHSFISYATVNSVLSCDVQSRHTCCQKYTNART